MCLPVFKCSPLLRLFISPRNWGDEISNYRDYMAAGRVAWGLIAKHGDTSSRLEVHTNLRHTRRSLQAAGVPKFTDRAIH